MNGASANTPCANPDCILLEHGGACMSGDLQEARGIRYVDALRVMLLSSGRWAVWPMESAVEPVFMPALDEAVLRGMMEAQRERRHRLEQEINARVRQRFEAKPAPVRNTKIIIDLSELF